MIENAHRILAYEARKRLGHLDLVKKGLREIRAQKSEFVSRFYTLEEVLNILSTFGDFRYQNVTCLREALVRISDLPPSFDNAIEVYQDLLKTSPDEPVLKHFEGSFKVVEQRIKEGDLNHLKDIATAKLPSYLLVEGYGMFAEYLMEQPGLSQKYVLAIEEVLVMNFPQSRLLKDLIGSVYQQKDQFAPEVQEKIDQLYSGFEGTI